MKLVRRRKGGALAAVAVLTLAACASKASVTAVDGPNSAFCNDMGAFQVIALGVDQAQSGDATAFKQQVGVVHTALVKLQGEANVADKVNGHLVKNDLAVLVDAYGQLVTGLGAAPTEAAAAAAVQAKLGGPAAAASGHLDAYAKQGCKVSATAATTTVAPAGGATTTPTPQVGPTVAPTGGATTTSGG